MTDREKEKLRWACRRGMLELDIFLLPYFDHCYHTLNVHQQNTFCELLSFPDPELYAWLMDHLPPPEEELANIVNDIRAYRLQSRSDPLL